MKEQARIIRFTFVGGIGFIVDALVLHCLISSFGVIGARAISFLVAVSVTWILNRTITFSPSQRSIRDEWFTYTIANSIGALFNFCCYSQLVIHYPFFHQNPIAALAIGSAVGLVFNFVASKSVVFKSATPR